jgi:hypothetical protein
MEERNEFVEFVQELVDGSALHGAAAGVATMVVSAGSMRGLSSAQHAALVVGVKAWITEHFPEYDPGFISQGEMLPTPECTESGDEVPWCEVYIAGAMNHGVCSWCMQVHHKGDD